MEKKTCKICGREFETEIEDTEICPECENAQAEEQDDLTIDEIENTAEEMNDIETEGNAENTETDENADSEGEGEPFGGGLESDESLSEEEILALEEEARKREAKKKKIITITAAVAGAAVLVSAVLFVPFKKDDAVYKPATVVNAGEKAKVISKRTNLFTLIQSSVEFAKNPDADMIIGGEKIDKSLFEYFYERAQYQLLMKNGMSSASSDEINKFWDNADNTKTALTNAKRDVITFVVAKQKAAEMGITLTDEEKSSIDQYISSYVNDEFLKQMKLTKEQVKYILEGSTLTSKLAQQVTGEEEKYNLTNEQVEAYVKANGEKITAKHILFTTLDQQTYQPLSDEKKAEVKKKAQETLDKIKNGEDFDKLMNELSEDPGLKQYPNGYTFGKGEMVEGFENAAFALKENEVSDLVETDYGIHIIKRVPLTMSDSDIQSAKSELQNALFEDEILTWAKSVKILTNDAAINASKPASYQTETKAE